MVKDAVSGAHPSLRDVFAGDLAKRLPRLVAWQAGTCKDVEAAVRDAHTLATSAILVGEPEISRLARGAEHGDVQMLNELIPLLQAWTP